MASVMEQLQRRFSPQPLHPGLEALEDAFCMVDRDGRITYWNAAAERLLRRTRSTVLGSPVEGILPFLSVPATLERVRRAHAEGRSLALLERFHGIDGAFVSVRIAPLPDGGAGIHLRDCTAEILRAERHLDLLESIRDGFMAVDEEWKITYLNSAAETLLRFRRQRAVGRSIWSLLPYEPPEIRESLRKTMTDGVRRHLTQVRPRGRVFRGRVFDLWADSLVGGGISILFEDVTERLQREQELARLAAEAEELNRAKNRFFAAVSHELRTPLNAIVGYTHLLNTGTYGVIPEAARRAAERAGVCAEHLARLVDDVLLLTGSEIQRLPVSPTAIDLRAFLPAVVAPIQLQAQAKGLVFELSIPADLPVIVTDSQRLRQLLLGLLSNAVKFTSRGSVSLAARVREPVTPRGADDLQHTSPMLEIMVEDTGPGVPPDARERIFGLFEQLGDPARSESMNRGSGTGLTVARQLAGLLGGELLLADTSPAGSRFALHLPLALNSAATADPHADRGNHPPERPA
jgi:PAS domain S-box-containing protein